MICLSSCLSSLFIMKLLCHYVVNCCQKWNILYIEYYIKCEQTHSSLCLFPNTACDISIYHNSFPHISKSLNIFMLKSSVIFNNLYIANVMSFTIKIKNFLFMFPYYVIKDIQKGKEIQNSSFTGLGMQFSLLMYMEMAYLFSYH